MCVCMYVVLRGERKARANVTHGWALFDFEIVQGGMVLCLDGGRRGQFWLVVRTETVLATYHWGFLFFVLFFLLFRGVCLQ